MQIYPNYSGRERGHAIQLDYDISCSLVDLFKKHKSSQYFFKSLISNAKLTALLTAGLTLCGGRTLKPKFYVSIYIFFLVVGKEKVGVGVGLGVGCEKVLFSVVFT